MNCFLRASRVLEGHFEPLLYIAVEYAFANNYKLANDFMRDAEKEEPSNPVIFHEQAAVAYLQGDFTSLFDHIECTQLVLFSCRRYISKRNSLRLQSNPT